MSKNFMLTPLLQRGGLIGLLVGAGLWATVALTQAAPVPHALQVGESCFATPDNGTTVYSSTNASAVRAALSAAAPNATVKIAGTCAGAVAQGGSTQVALITKTVTVAGGYTLTNWTTYNPTANPTLLDAQAGGRVLSLTVAATLRGFTVTNGYITSTVNQYGGGIFAAGALTLTDMRVAGNILTGTTGIQDGGGVYVGGVALVTNTVFTQNRADDFGGGARFNTTASVTGTTFSNNVARNGGGGALFSSAGNVWGTTFSGNRVNGNGGGTYFQSLANVAGTVFTSNQALNSGGGAWFQSTASVTGTAFSSNTANEGGGAWFNNTTHVTGTIFNNNIAATSGGGAYFNNATAKQLVNGLFTRNRASGNGAAIFVADAAPLRVLHATIVSPTTPTGGTQAVYVAAGTVYLTNTLVASHTVGIQRAGGIVSEWYGLYSSVAAPYNGAVTASGSFTSPVVFAAPTSNNYHLGPCSVAINAGTAPNPNVTFDIDGETRPQQGSYDIGYDETPSQPCYTLAVAKAGTGNGVVTPTVGVYTYTSGTAITFTAVANLGSTFMGWSVNGSPACVGANMCVVTMTANRVVTANFALNTYSLTVAMAGTGSGVVTPTVGVYTYTYGSTITLTAAPTLGSAFTGWTVSGSAPCAGTGACVVTLTNPVNITATFATHKLYLPFVQR